MLVNLFGIDTRLFILYIFLSFFFLSGNLLLILSLDSRKMMCVFIIFNSCVNLMKIWDCIVFTDIVKDSNRWGWGGSNQVKPDNRIKYSYRMDKMKSISVSQDWYNSDRSIYMNHIFWARGKFLGWNPTFCKTNNCKEQNISNNSVWSALDIWIYFLYCICIKSFIVRNWLHMRKVRSLYTVQRVDLLSKFTYIYNNYNRNLRLQSNLLNSNSNTATLCFIAGLECKSNLEMFEFLIFHMFSEVLRSFGFITPENIRKRKNLTIQILYPRF